RTPAFVICFNPWGRAVGGAAKPALNLFLQVRHASSARIGPTGSRFCPTLGLQPRPRSWFGRGKTFALITSTTSTLAAAKQKKATSTPQEGQKPRGLVPFRDSGAAFPLGLPVTRLDLRSFPSTIRARLVMRGSAGTRDLRSAAVLI
ncbi:MAG: hypothetical protein ACK48X_07795, partial [Planctomycetota bacterium]